MYLKKWFVAYSVYLLASLGIGFLSFQVIVIKPFFIQLLIALALTQFVFSVVNLKIHFLVAILSTTVITFISLSYALNITKAGVMSIGYKGEGLLEVILLYGIISIVFLILFQLLYIKYSKLLKRIIQHFFK